MDPLDQFDFVIEMKKFLAELLINELNLSKTSRFYTNDKGFNVIGEYTKGYRHNAHSAEASSFYRRLFGLSDNEALDWTKVRKYVPTITSKKQSLKLDNVEQLLTWIKFNKLYKYTSEELSKRLYNVQPCDIEDFEDEKLFNSVTNAIMKYHGVKVDSSKGSGDQVVPQRKLLPKVKREEPVATSTLLDANDGGKRKNTEPEYFPTQRNVLNQINQLKEANNLNVKKVRRDKHVHV